MTENKDRSRISANRAALLQPPCDDGRVKANRCPYAYAREVATPRLLVDCLPMQPEQAGNLCSRQEAVAGLQLFKDRGHKGLIRGFNTHYHLAGNNCAALAVFGSLSTYRYLP